MAHAYWRTGDLLLPMRATSSCHRCRSRAGWRDRQVLSGCRSIDIASATYVNGRSKAALKNGGKRPFGFDVVDGIVAQKDSLPIDRAPAMIPVPPLKRSASNVR